MTLHRIIRFEDLVFNPQEKAKKMLQYVNMSLNPDVLMYLKKHTEFTGLNTVCIHSKLTTRERDLM